MYELTLLQKCLWFVRHGTFLELHWLHWKGIASQEAKLSGGILPREWGLQESRGVHCCCCNQVVNNSAGRQTMRFCY